MRRLAIFLLFLPLPALAECRQTAPEQFAPFFARYAADKAFANGRAILPSYHLRHEYDAEDKPAPQRHAVSAADLAAGPTLGDFARENGMVLLSSAKGRRAVVRMEKPDTDWLLSFHFVRKGHCWYLHHSEDHSL